MALALPATLPQMPLPVLDGNNFTLPWYRLLQALSAARNNAVDPAVIALLEAQIAALQAAIAAIEAEIAALPAASGSEALTFALTSLLDGFFTVRDAKRWTTARTLSFTGDVTGSGSVDGSANVATALTFAPTMTATAVGALSAGNIVYLSNSSGAKVTKANATDLTKPARGFVLSAYASNASATVHLGGYVTGLSSLSPGATYYLDTTGGAITTTPPAVAGNGDQIVGIAGTATALWFAPQLMVGV